MAKKDSMVKEDSMANEECCEKGKCRCKCGRGGMHLGSIYGMTVIGAAVYFIQHSAGFWLGVLGVLKALAWPAFVMYQVLDLLKM